MSRKTTVLVADDQQNLREHLEQLLSDAGYEVLLAFDGQQALRKCRRDLPDVALIDVDRPTTPVIRQGHTFYFDRVVPFIGGLLSDRAAYAYLPASTAYLPPEGELLAMLRRAGFEDVRRTSHLLGAIQTLTGIRDKTT